MRRGGLVQYYNIDNPLNQKLDVDETLKFQWKERIAEIFL